MKLSLTKKNWYRLSILFLLILAFALRFFRLGSVPVSLYWDEAAILADAKVVAETGRDLHGHRWQHVLFPSYGDYKLPVYIWLTSLAVNLFGVQAWVVRLPSALAGVATVWLVGLLAKKMAGNADLSKEWRRWSMLVMAIAPWSLLFSRTGFEGHLAQFFLGSSLYLAVLSKEKPATSKSWWQLFFSLALGLLATYTYFSVRFIWLPLMVLIEWLNIKPNQGNLKSNQTNKQHQPSKKNQPWISSKLPRFSHRVVRTIAIIIIFFLGLWPMRSSPFYAESEQIRYSTQSLLNDDSAILKQNQLRELAGNGLIDRILFHRGFFWLQALVSNLSDQVSFNFIFLQGDPNLRHGTGQNGLFYLIFLPCFLVGIYQLTKQRFQLLIFLSSWWLLAQLPAIVPLSTPHALRSLNALIPLTLIIAYGLAAIWNWLKKDLKGLKKLLGQSLVVGLIIFSLGAFYYHYQTQYRLDSSSSFQNGYQQLARLVVQRRQQVQQILIEGFDDRYFLWLWLQAEFSPQEIQAAVTHQFRPRQLDSIQLGISQALNKANQDIRSSLVIGERASLEKQLELIKLETTSIENRISELSTVVSLDGQKQYLVIKVDQADR